MADTQDSQAGLIGTRGVIAGDHPPVEPVTVLVGPTTAGEFNTIEERLVPKGCFRIEDVLFEFDSSFPLPDVKTAMPTLQELRERHKQGNVFPPLSIFGHGDPVGNDDYNKRLSGRRAQSIYAMLVRDEALWEDLFSHPAGGDQWGKVAVSTMLEALGHTADPESQTESIKSFQSEQGLAVDGVAGPKTRKALFRAYMDFLCGPDLELDKERDFLGRHGDLDGKGDFQGCSEFNPIRMFSEEENAQFEKAADKTDRNRENEPNRRVMILLFAPGRRVNPSVWPCPRAKEGVADCKKRFFPDADRRRSFQGQHREFDQTKDTFACRFYQIISDDSPCEAAVPFVLELVGGRLPSLFSAGKTFPKPSCIPMLREVVRRASSNTNTRILIVGHTDSTGNDATNLTLSMGRAAAVEAFLRGDKEFFRSRFESPDPLSVWEWEEIQWMLSAIEIDGDPCYAGLVDAHASDMTHAALQAFQLANELEPTHLAGEATLGRLIERYLETLGPARPQAKQIERVAGGESHPPRAFGKGGQRLTGPEFDTPDLPGFRRVDVFLSSIPFRPPANSCPATPHSRCPAYEKWCDSVVEELVAAQNFTMAIRFVDRDGSPLAKLPISLFEVAPGDDALVASLTTTKHGVVRLSLPHGHFALGYNVAGEEQRAGFVVSQDEVGGMTVRLAEDLAQMERRRQSFRPIPLV